LISFDTNILVCAVDRDATDRHDRAVSLIERAIGIGNCVQPLQTFCEFFNVATRKVGIEPRAASVFVEAWQAVIPVEPCNVGDLVDAMRAVGEYRLSFWDALLWATVRRIGVRLLLSEDFQDGRLIEGVRIVNPFGAHNDAILENELG
jgi:predicted nucleic acid-binding protein